jgi:hypothetical protein
LMTRFPTYRPAQKVFASKERRLRDVEAGYIVSKNSPGTRNTDFLEKLWNDTTHRYNYEAIYTAIPTNIVPESPKQLGVCDTLQQPVRSHIETIRNEIYTVFVRLRVAVWA